MTESTRPLSPAEVAGTPSPLVGDPLGDWRGPFRHRVGWVVSLIGAEVGVLSQAETLHPGILRAAAWQSLLADLLIGAVAFAVCLPVMMFVHELGHIVAARIVGMSPTALDWGAGPVRSQRSLRGFVVIRRTTWFAGAHVRLRGQPTRWQMFVVTSAGPLTHLLTAMGIFMWGRPLSRPADDVAFGLAVALLVLNVWPRRTGKGRASDGRQMLDALTGASRTSPLKGLDAERLRTLLVNDPRELLRLMGPVLQERPTLVGAQALTACAWALVGRHDRAWDSWDAVMALAPDAVYRTARWDAVFSAVLLGLRTADDALLATGLTEVDAAVGTSSPTDPSGEVQAARHTLAMAHVLAGSPAIALGLCTQLEHLLTEPVQLAAVRATIGFAQLRAGDQGAANGTLGGLRREFPANQWTLALERRLDTAPL